MGGMWRIIRAATRHWITFDWNELSNSWHLAAGAKKEMVIVCLCFFSPCSNFFEPQPWFQLKATSISLIYQSLLIFFLSVENDLQIRGKKWSDAAEHLFFCKLKFRVLGCNNFPLLQFLSHWIVYFFKYPP